MNNEAMLKECLDRLRRVETRLTTFLEASGMVIQVERPTFKDGVVYVPTPSVSMRDCLAVVPEEWYDKRVLVKHKGDVLAIVIK